MQKIWTGMLGGTICGLLLTIMAIYATPDSGSELDGMKFAVVCFGVLGFPQILFGAAIGFVVHRWSRLIDERKNVSIDFVFGDNVTLGLIAIFVAAVTAGFDVAVASHFVRDIFRLAALCIVYVGASAVGFAAYPVFRAIVSRFSPRVPSDDGETVFAGLIVAAAIFTTITCVPFALVVHYLLPYAAAYTFLIALITFFSVAFVITDKVSKPAERIARTNIVKSYGLQIILAVASIGIVIGVAGAGQLNIWSTGTLFTFVIAFVGTPLGLVATQRIGERARGFGLAGFLVSAVSLFLAASWSSADSDMRSRVTGERDLLAVHTGALQKVGDLDGDGYAQYFGGFDCDDQNANAYPGAEEIPGNGIDEDCSGADTETIVREHQGISLVRRAIGQSRAAVAKLNEKLPEAPKNVVFLMIDTLRYDHLGFAGYGRPTSPNIDQIASQGSVFERAYATSPHTPRSIPAMFFSRYASKTKWRGAQYNYPKILPENLSMFEILEERGYETIGVSSHFYFQEKQGIRQGFTSWDNEGFGTIAESNNDIASPRTYKKLVPIVERLGKSDKPFALFVHLFEPHARWIKHDAYDFGKGATNAERHMNNYDSEIAFVDSYVAKIVAQLKAHGIWDNSIIVLTSDHGEGFDEHGYFYHGQTLYNEVIHVPMVWRVPGWPARRVDTPVSIVDIAPTLLDLLGMPIPESFQGESLVQAMVGQPLEERPLFAELLPYTSWKEHHKAVVVGDWKMIHVISAGRRELYNLRDDPMEKNNLWESEKDRADELAKHLEAFQQMP